MFLTNQISIEALVQDYVPGAKVIVIGNSQIIFFSFHDIYFNQKSIMAFWRVCNQYHLRPVAKTILGRVRAIKFVIG